MPILNKTTLASSLTLLCLCITQTQAETHSFRLSSAQTRVASPAVSATAAQVQIESIDANQRVVVNDVARVLRLQDSTQVFPSSGTLMFPAGVSSITAQLSGAISQTHLSLQNFTGPLQLQAVQANAPTVISNVLPLQVVNDYWQASVHPDFQNNQPAGVSVNAFQLLNSDGSAAQQANLQVSHIDSGLTGAAREIISTASSDDNGVVALSFTQATGNLSTRSDEYYLLTPNDSGIAQMVLPNVGNDGNRDIVAGSAGQVQVSEASGATVTTLSVSPFDSGYVLDLDTVTFNLADSFGNAITDETVVIDSNQWASLASGVLETDPNLRVRYGSGFLRDVLSLNFTQPLGLASVDFDVALSDAPPRLEAFAINNDFALLSSDALFSGGSRSNREGAFETQLFAPSTQTITTQLHVLPPVAHRGQQAKPFVLAFWKKPNGEGLWWDWIASEVWDLNPAKLGVFNEAVALDSQSIQLFELSLQYRAFGSGNQFIWVAGYRILGSEELHFSFVNVGLL